MNFIKKNVIVALYGLVVLLMVAGCSGNQDEASASEGDSDGGQSSNSAVEIEFWYGLGGNLGDNMKRIIDEFNQSQDEVVVTGIAQADYSETYQKLQAAIAAQQVPAAVLLGSDTVNALAQKQALAPMDSFIAEQADFEESDFVEAFYHQGNVNGTQFALPLYGTTQVLYYREDVFNELGISPDALNNWETLLEAAETIKEEKEIYGWMPMWGSGNLIDATLSRGGTILNEDGTEVTIDSEEWIDTWEFFRKAIHEDEVMGLQHGGQGWEYWYKTIDDVLQNRAAGYTGSSGDQGDLDFTIVSAHKQPGWEGDDPAPVADALQGSITALASEEEQQAAFKFLSYFTSPEVTADWSMNTGYIAVRKSARDVAEFQQFAEENPQILVPLEQAETASTPFIDPTGGKITDAISKAADLVEIENIPAEKALSDAKEEAQQALDEILTNN
ncbi:multiple sugar transport system substrate-binding protein [Gracilibacillus ureilyticus]|uniref:Multiple sugar transport system substrate-binding protein n=2 Tax=Gracilibacillus ureilyticus TaxID=531814 RepID=A0A1H9ULW2_9BACI|nr:multiple sugar transport system substrate-binding protein [Gracilibacillus ureilyticus]